MQAQPVANAPHVLPLLTKKISLPSSESLSFPPLRSDVRQREIRAFLSTTGSVSFRHINGNCRCTSAQTLTSSNSREKATCTWGGRIYVCLYNLSFRGEMCSGKKEGMIGEIKLKCKKKNISNRRELLPVVMAKMLSRCSERIHVVAGSPTDYPDMMMIRRVLEKLLYFYSLREPSCWVQLSPWWLSCPLLLWVSRSSPQSQAGQPYRHSCSISAPCQMVWYVFKGTANEAEQHSEQHNFLIHNALSQLYSGTIFLDTA